MIAEVIGQVAAEHGGVLLTYGPMGVMLAWFMWRSEKLGTEVRSLAHRIDGLTRALLMDMVNRDNVGPATKAMAQTEIAKITARLPQG